MSDLDLSTIAQLLFRNDQSLDFARTVAELEGVLSRLQADQVRIAWDCDDFVCFDIPGTRIQLAWAQVARRGYSACLTISVGPGEPASPRFHEDMCSRLVDRIQARFDPVAVMWCQTESEVGAEFLDTLLDSLPHLGTVLPEVESLVGILTEQEARLSTSVTMAKRLKPARAPQAAANDDPNLVAAGIVDLSRVRKALYPQPYRRPPYSPQMRLAVHCLNATLILVWAPIGLAVVGYSVLRGEDMRLSARAMALTGTFMALAQSPVGMSMAVMAQSFT